MKKVLALVLSLAMMLSLVAVTSANAEGEVINVMYGGKIIETGPTEEIVTDPVHPYAHLLIGAAPNPARYKGSGHSAVQASSTNAPVDNSIEVLGCRFANRCPFVTERCVSAPIPEYVSTDGTRKVMCILAEDRTDFHNPSDPAHPGDTSKSEEPTR